MSKFDSSSITGQFRSPSTSPHASSSLAYLFERFPTFTQTFCVREIDALQELGLQVPIYSIRQRPDEHQQDVPEYLQEITQYVPNVKEMARWWMTPFAFRARAAKRKLVEKWGQEGDRNRAYEAVWLGPRLLRRGVRHVHVHFAGLAARTAYWLKQLYGIEYSFTAHANDFMVTSAASRLRDIFAEAKFVITVSDYSLNLIREAYPQMSDRVHRVYNGINIAEFPKAKFVTPPMILSVGRYIEKKGFLDLIDACALLRDVDFRCVLIGEGELETKMRQQIAALQLEDKVIVAGPKSEKEIKELLAQASVFVLACRSESDGGRDNLPTVIMEAMAAKLPVISTHLAGVPEMVKDEQTGYLVREGDIAALADRMRCLLLHPDVAKQKGDAGYQLAETLFDIKRTSGQLIQIFVRYKTLTNAECGVRDAEWGTPKAECGVRNGE